VFEPRTAHYKEAARRALILALSDNDCIESSTRTAPHRPRGRVRSRKAAHCVGRQTPLRLAIVRA
jgi:hypothetical protein